MSSDFYPGETVRRPHTTSEQTAMPPPGWSSMPASGNINIDTNTNTNNQNYTTENSSLMINDWSSTSPSGSSDLRLSYHSATASQSASWDSPMDGLDYEILNDVSCLENLDFSQDFLLFPHEATYGDYTNTNLFADVSTDDMMSMEVSQPPWLDSMPSECWPANESSANSLLIDAPQAKFPCDFCPLGFEKRHELNRHRLKHTKPYKCRVDGCGAAFAESRGRERHMKARHLATDIVQCQWCSYNSTRPDAVQRHVRTKHNVQVSFKSGKSPTTTMGETQR